MKVCFVVWMIGTFSISALPLIDYALPLTVSGKWIDNAFFFTIATALLTSIAAPLALWQRFVAFVLSLALFALQFIVIGIVVLMTNGLDGTQ